MTAAPRAPALVRAPDARRGFLEAYETYSTGPVVVLVIFWLVTVLDPAAITRSDMPAWLQANLHWVITGLFAADLGLRLIVARERLPYLRRNWLDAVAIVIPVARVLRLALSAWRVVQASRGRFSQALFKVLGIALGVVVSGSLLVWILEATNPDSPVDSLGEAMWWALATISTVGYGDVVPITAFGRLVGVAMIVLGVAVFSTFVAALQASAAEEASTELDARLDQLQAQVQELQGMVATLLARIPPAAPPATAGPDASPEPDPPGGPTRPPG